jgi:3-oxoacyl-[acyl-carrier protein] reductase
MTRPRYPELSGKVAVITGSGRGIGQATAIRLAREGMKLVVHGLKADEVDYTVAGLKALGADVIGVTSDLATLDGIDLIFQTALTTFSDIHLMVNNAADLRRTPLFSQHAPPIETSMNVNIRAPYECARRAAAVMREHGGTIINISSVGGLRAHWSGLPYDMMKGALDTMTRAMALELGEYGICVNAVAPGAIHANVQGTSRGQDSPKGRVPLERFGHPLEIGNAVAFLVSDDARYITGQVIYVDGGITAQLGPKNLPI